MPLTKDQIAAEISNLSRSEQIELAQTILTEMRPEHERAWIEESERRLRDYEAGKSKADIHSEFLQELNKKLG